MDKNQDPSEFNDQHGQSHSFENEDNEDINMPVDDILSNSDNEEFRSRCSEVDETATHSNINISNRSPNDLVAHSDTEDDLQIGSLLEEPDILTKSNKQVPEVDETAPHSNINTSNRSPNDLVAHSDTEDDLQIGSLLEEPDIILNESNKHVSEVDEAAPHSNISISNRSPKDLVAESNTEADPKTSNLPKDPRNISHESTCRVQTGGISWERSYSTADQSPDDLDTANQVKFYFLQHNLDFLDAFSRELSRVRIDSANSNTNTAGQSQSNLATLPIIGNDPEPSDPQRSYEEIVEINKEVLQTNEASENSDINPIGRSPRILVPLSNTDNNGDSDIRQEFEDDTSEELPERNEDAQK